MDPPRPAPRSNIPGPPTSNNASNIHNNLLARPNVPGTGQDSLNPPSNQSWPPPRESASGGSSSDAQQQSQSQGYSGQYAPPFDGYLGMSSQSDILNSSAGNGANSANDPNKLKKRGRDEHDDLDANPDPGSKFNPSPQRIAELTAGFPTPPTSNGPPALITTGRMTKTHADPLIAQLINPDGTPKRPMNAFMIFARKRRPEVAADNPNLRTGEISKLLSAEWKAIDTESKQFYLTKAKELKENFTSIFPTYVYKRRPNNSRKRRKTEDTGYGGAGAMSAINRGEGGMSDEEDISPGSMSPGMPPSHAGHMGGMPGIGGMGAPGMPRRPGDPMQMPHHQQPHHGMVPPPPHHDLPNAYSIHGSQPYGHRGQSNSQMYYDAQAGPRGTAGLWAPQDAKREPKSPRMEGNGHPGSHSSALRIPGGGGGSGPPPPSQNGGGGMRSSNQNGSSYPFSIPSPNFGPAPGLPPIGRSGQTGQSNSNPPSASQTPLLTPSMSSGGSMLPPPTTGNIYGHSHSSSHGHSSSHSLPSTGHGGHTHAHSGSYFEPSWPRTQQSPSSSSLNINGPPSSSTSSAAGGPTSNDRQSSSSRNRSDSLGGAAQQSSSSSGQWM